MEYDRIIPELEACTMDFSGDKYAVRLLLLYPCNSRGEADKIIDGLISNQSKTIIRRAKYEKS